TIKKAAPPRAANRRPQIGVLVLGKHRSGTSALTRVLNLLGCALPEALVDPSEGNEMGHWEAASAVILNDQILASAGSSWNDWGPINDDWRASGVREQMIERAAEVIRDHKSLGPLFALKDPRLCRLADLWLEAADLAHVDMRVVLMLRHPGEVAASLESRDLMTAGYGQLLWLRHTLDAEHLSRGRKRAVCRFDRLLQDWQDTIDRVRQGLDLALPRNSPASHAEVEKFLTRDMRHHDARGDTGLGLLGASNWLRRTFEIMQHWSEQGEDPADHAELDRIRAEFDHAYPAFSRLLLSAEFSGEFATGHRLRAQLQEQLAEVSERAQDI
ncbi:MAG: sulfotransferase family protein, partial [Alphaproteobacteria bacterium PA3]